MNKYYIGLVLFLFIVACSGGKKKTLEPAEIENEEAIAPRDSLQVSAVVYNAVEGIEISKMLDHAMGSKANSTNLIELKLTQPEKEEKESASLYPKEYTLDCHIEDAIPILAYNAKQYGNKLYTSYTKRQLSEIISSDKFSNYPSSLQEKINTLNTNLPDGSLLVAILK